MTLLIAGLVLFIGAHLVPTVPSLRARLVGSLGDRRYRGAFALVSAIGLVAIVVGYARAAPAAAVRLFAPLPVAIEIAPYAMVVAFVLFAAANMRGHIRHALQHPMLLGLIVWSFVHLLANGDLRGTVLFGSFLVYGLVDIVSAVARHAIKPFEPEGKYDVMAAIGGTVVAIVVMAFHRMLFGVSPVPFSL